jgi:acetyl-CoA acetyltransferase
MSGFALVAQRHMHQFGTKREHLAEAAATIRNHGHVNSEPLMYGKGPYATGDVLDPRMIADRLHLLDCSVSCHGGAAIVVTTGKPARELRAGRLELVTFLVAGGGARRRREERSSIVADICLGYHS